MTMTESSGATTNGSQSNHSSTQPESNGQQSEAPVTKQTFRKKVWIYLEKNRLSSYPRPVYGRVPNFKEAEKAASQLLHLDAFKFAQSVEVNPDKSLEHARLLVLEQNKTLYVPVPRLENGLLKQLTRDDNVGNRKVVSAWGVEHTGKNIDLDEKLHLDLLILGSVAVSKRGRRIGKGKGYADLEYGILKEMGAVDDSTVIATIVHDSQVFDDLPEELFKKHDVPVDYILTPTQIITVQERLPRPEKVYWDILSQRRVNLMVVLQKLKEKHLSEGREVELKDVDSDVEEMPKRRRFNNTFRRNFRRRPIPKENKENHIEDKEKKVGMANRRFNRRFYYRKRQNKDQVDKTVKSETKENTSPKKQKPRHIDFSLRVGNIEKNVRVRDLKNALNENGIKPDYITWRGVRGFCFLHYAKPKKSVTLKSANNNNEDKKAEEASQSQQPFAVDNVINILQNLKIGAESANSLDVKVVEPITRIETTDATADRKSVV